MKAALRRLDKVETSLAPKQLVLRWLDRMLGFESEEAYGTSLVEGPTMALPRIRLAESAGRRAVKQALRGTPPELVERAIRDAVRDVCFLTKLVIDVTALVGERVEVFGVQTVMCARGLQLLLVEQHLTRQGKRAMKLPGAAGRVLQIRDQVEALLVEVYAVSGVVERVSRGYFDGHPMLFRERVARLSAARETAETLVDGYNVLIAGPRNRRQGQGPSRQGKTAKPRRSARDAAIDVEPLRASAERNARDMAAQCVDLAKADALWDVGQGEAAARLLKSHMGVGVPTRG